MNKTEIEDDLRPEYDLKSLQVRKTGAGRKGFGDMVRLEPDVITAFPDAKSVNAALRSLIDIAKRSTNLNLKNNPPLL
ncbi:hypothetical protein [Crenothrix sp.]|uniref:hypothetical protein n=1 Tax=Crenothrix sp. TaxID=3100433 RepID=UPI00374D4666